MEPLQGRDLRRRIAAVEGLLRLRTLVGDAVDVTLVAPNDELRYRPLAVDEPFARRGVRRYPLRTIARRTGAEWVQDAVEWIDPDAQTVHTAAAGSPYDALLLAVGARWSRPSSTSRCSTTPTPTRPTAASSRTWRAATRAASRCCCPEGPAWLLPAYELALMTAERAEQHGEEGSRSTS